MEARSAATLHPTNHPALLDPTDALPVRGLHGDLPHSDTPYADVARELCLSETEVVDGLRAMLDEGVPTCFGPLFQIAARSS